MRDIIYRIETNHGVVDFSPNIEVGTNKFLRYVNDMYDGYSDWVSLIEVNVITGTGRKIMGAKRFSYEPQTD